MSDLFGNHNVGFPTRPLIYVTVFDILVIVESDVGNLVFNIFTTSMFTLHFQKL